MATVILDIANGIVILCLVFSLAMLAVKIYIEFYPWVKKKVRPVTEQFTFITDYDVGCYSDSGVYLFTDCPECERTVALKVDSKCSDETMKRGVYFGLECYHCERKINIMVKKHVRSDR